MSYMYLVILRNRKTGVETRGVCALYINSVKGAVSMVQDNLDCTDGVWLVRKKDCSGGWITIYRSPDYKTAKELKRTELEKAQMRLF